MGEKLKQDEKLVEEMNHLEQAVRDERREQRAAAGGWPFKRKAQIGPAEERHLILLAEQAQAAAMEKALRAAVPRDRWFSHTTGDLYERQSVTGLDVLLAEQKRSCASWQQGVAVAANAAVGRGWITEAERQAIVAIALEIPEAVTEARAEREAERDAFQSEWQQAIDGHLARCVKGGESSGLAFQRALSIWNRDCAARADRRESLQRFKAQLKAAEPNAPEPEPERRPRLVERPDGLYLED